MPVETEKIPRPPKDSKKPDWNAGEMRDPNSDIYYKSQKAVGKLYRDIKMPDPPQIPTGLLMPAFHRVIDAAEERRLPMPPPQWPAYPTAEQRLHPSQYPALPKPAPIPSPALTGVKHKATKPAATTIKVVQNNSSHLNNGISSLGSPRFSPQSLSTLHHPVPPGLGISPTPPLTPPGLGLPPGLSLPPGLNVGPQSANGVDQDQSGSATSSNQASTSTTLSRNGRATKPSGKALKNSTRGNSNAPLENGNRNLFLAVTDKLRQIARPYIDLDSTSKEVKAEIQLAYGRYVIELQHVSISLALDEDLTEEEVRRALKILL